MISRRVLIAVSVLLVAALALGAYLWRVRSHIATTAPLADSRPVEPPASGPVASVTLWLADDQAGVLHPTTANLPLSADLQTRAQEILRAVVNSYLDPASPHRLPSGAEVRNVFLVAPGLAVIDVNAALANEHRSGILVEELTVASLVQTLAANQSGITRVRVLVDGRPRQTLAGHIDLSSDFDTSAMSEAVKALQPSS